MHLFLWNMLARRKIKFLKNFILFIFWKLILRLLFYLYCIIFKTSPLPIRYKRHVAFFLLVSWMARPRPKWGRPRVVHCDVASRDSYFPFDSYPSHSRYVISLAFQPGLESLFNTARHSPLFRSTLLSSFRKENDAREREREGGDLLNYWLKSFASSPLRSYTRSESLKIEGRMGINVNKSGVYIDIIWLIYINTVSRCYCDYCIRVCIENINEQVKTMHVDG